jgi:hypothetical protein
MGSPWKHRLISKDPEAMTGVCAACGPVKLQRQLCRGKVALLCKTASRVSNFNGKFRHAHLRKMTPQIFREMAASQDWACAICGEKPNVLHIDHDHATSKIRGLFCRACNLGLGFFRDDAQRLLKAMEYLQRSSSR